MEQEAVHSSLWLAGLRRAWLASGALDAWVEDRGVTGVVWTPAAYELEDVAEAAIRLTGSGARVDGMLLWDLAVTDARTAAEALLPVHRSTQGLDGYVAVWLDPNRAGDGQRAVAAAREAVGDVGRPNVAVGLAWTSARASVFESLVGAGFVVALGGVRDAATADAVAASRTRALDGWRAQAKEDEEVPDVPVFLLGLADGAFAVPLTTEFDLLANRPPKGRVPLTPDAETAGLKAAVDRLTARVAQPLHDDAYEPNSFADATSRETAELDEDDVLEDIWSRDYTIWSDDPTEIADRLGWLDVADRMHGELADLNEFARKARSSAALKTIVLCGMGGSSLAPQTFNGCVGGGVPLTLVDTTHPAQIEDVTKSLDLEHTLFVIASKSGTTIETRAHLEYFWSLAPRGDRFVAITDPGTELATVAKERNFLRTFENPPDIGGRYSALSYFGLVPAALAGVDIDAIVNGARRAMSINAPGTSPAASPAMRLGAALFAAFKSGRDKLTFVLPNRLASFGDWIEQLIAESTGKESTGVLPVVGEPIGHPDVYGSDRVFCTYTLGDSALDPALEALEAEHPVARVGLGDVKSLGAEMFRWELATAVLGYLLDINPFDQPDVESAKKRARDALENRGVSRPDPGSVRDVLADIAPPRYIAIQAFVQPSETNTKRLQDVRTKLRDRHMVAVTTGFGPRFLHSTGQLHKGGPTTGVFIQVTDEHASDVDVPGMGFSFGQLIDAQADGDLQALRDAGRPAARVSLHELEAVASGGAE